jgi:hypothetical protein
VYIPGNAGRNKKGKKVSGEIIEIYYPTLLGAMATVAFTPAAGASPLMG